MLHLAPLLLCPIAVFASWFTLWPSSKQAAAQAESQQKGKSGSKKGSVSREKSQPLAKKETDRPFYSSSCPIEFDFAVAADYFRSLPEGSFEGNMGAYGSLNMKASLPHAIFLQAGGSYGAYDWAGRSSTPTSTESKKIQEQVFVTGALSRETPSFSGFNAGLAYDGMWNRNFGLFAKNPYIAQVRGKLGYLFKGGNEIGLWGTINVLTVHEEDLLEFRAVCQANAFWCHNFGGKSYLMLWGGVPYKRGLMYNDGSSGKFLAGARFDVQVTKSLSLFGHGSYMGAKHQDGLNEAKNYAANVCFGISLALGKRRVQKSHYMELADNSNFIVDTNLN